MAKTKIIILDCCYSGAAIESGLAAINNLEAEISSGAFLMTACTNYGVAWYEDESDSPEPQTYFTRHLVDLEEARMPGEPDVLRLGPLFHRLKLGLIDAKVPEPKAQNIDTAYNFAFARNAAPDGGSILARLKGC